MQTGPSFEYWETFMTLRAIMVHVSPAAFETGRVDAGISLAHQFRAQLIASADASETPSAAGPFFRLAAEGA
jgi:hypothetical protein